MIDTLEQFEQAEEAITKMKRFLLAIRRTHRGLYLITQRWMAV